MRRRCDGAKARHGATRTGAARGGLAPIAGPKHVGHRNLADADHRSVETVIPAQVDRRAKILSLDWALDLDLYRAHADDLTPQRGRSIPKIKADCFT